MKLGGKQIDLLRQCAVPSSILMTTDRTSDSLVAKGLLRMSSVAKATCITPAGLRWLADELEAGRMQDGLELARRHREARN